MIRIAARSLAVPAPLALSVLLALWAPGALADDGDPFIGTWRLNPTATHYESGDLPASMTVVMEPIADAVRYRSQTTQRDGRITTAQYTAAYDGRPVMVVGDAGLLTPVKLERIEPRSVTAYYVRAGAHVVAESHRVLSADGTKMTVTTVFNDTAGKKLTNIGVYEKQVPASR